jgi:transposase
LCRHIWTRILVSVVLDNGSSQQETLAWVAKHNRLHLPFTPTHASWLNQIEIWFGILTRKVVRHAIFQSRGELIERMMASSWHITSRRGP